MPPKRKVIYDTFLSAAQEAYLNSVADGYSPIRGYARGILGLLKDRVYSPDVYDFSEERSNPMDRIEPDVIKIYPVPANEQLVVTWPVLPESTIAQMQVFDILGAHLLSEPLVTNENARVLNTANLSEGIYIFVIRDKEGIIYRAKFAVQH